jgi:coenzyme F420 biosynthesis associated uncharacterized protein
VTDAITAPGTAAAPAPEPVDWATARRVARFVAGREQLADSYLLDALVADFETVTAEADALVTEFTGLQPPSRPRAGVLDRPGWVDANVASMRRLIAPVTAKLGARMSHSPLGPVGRHATGAEVGLLLGYMSQRVLGQYDLLVPEEGRPADAGDEVYYLGVNVLALEKRFGFRPLEFRRWIAIHELTHRAQFTGVPWLRGYFLSLVERTLGMVEPDPRVMLRAVARAAEALSRGRNPFDEAGVIGLFVSEEQRARLDEVQALMSLLEGHGNHVMNVLGKRHVQGVERMDRVLTARREARGVSGQLQKVLGIQMKLRQYALGEAFLTAVVDRAGERAIDAAWTGPEALPTLQELHTPDAWLARVHGATPSRRRDA